MSAFLNTRKVVRIAVFSLLEVEAKTLLNSLISVVAPSTPQRSTLNCCHSLKVQQFVLPQTRGLQSVSLVTLHHYDLNYKEPAYYSK